MRKNKKLLLASVAAMGALALGVGATSTFAWYTVNASVSRNVSGNLGEIVTSCDLNLSGQQIDITLAREDSGNMALTHATGDTSYESVVLANGVKQEDGLAKKLVSTKYLLFGIMLD